MKKRITVYNELEHNSKNKYHPMQNKMNVSVSKTDWKMISAQRLKDLDLVDLAFHRGLTKQGSLNELLE